LGGHAAWGGGGKKKKTPPPNEITREPVGGKPKSAKGGVGGVWVVVGCEKKKKNC